MPVLPRLPGGRAARIVLLAYGYVDTDARVLKTAVSLRQAGAEVLVVALAPHRSVRVPGPGSAGDGVPVHRTTDLDLARALAPVARVWRRLRGRGGGPARAVPSLSQASLAPPLPAGRPSAPPTSRTGPREALTEAYMRGFRTVRLLRYHGEAALVAHRFGADVVHANDGNTLLPALVLRALRGTRLVYDSHELWLRRNVRPDRWLAPAVERLTEAVGVRVADAVITVSPSIVDWLQQHYAPAEPPFLVRNIPRWPGALPDPARGRLRELAGLGADTRVLSYTGGIASGRGLEECLDALAYLGPEVHLVVLGFGSRDQVARVRRHALQAGVADRFHLVDPVPTEQVPATLADADLALVLVRPVVLSYRYALPNKLFESVHAGLPVVAADLPDLATVVRGHALGEVVNPQDPRALAAAVERVLADRERHRAAVAAAAPLFDWEQEARVLVRAHARAVAGCRS
jgi:glycosyltransferase involved in cell wall biosynthesis